jgi:hypothetical protein
MCRKIIAENEAQYRREVARREAALTQKLVRTSEGPAHHIVQVHRRSSRLSLLSSDMCCTVDSSHQCVRKPSERHECVFCCRARLQAADCAIFSPPYPYLSPSQALVEEKSKREKEFYESLFRADNSLNTQLKTSEDGMLRLKHLNFSHPHGRYFTAWCTMRCKLCSIQIDTTQLLLRINVSHILSSFSSAR